MIEERPLSRAERNRLQLRAEILEAAFTEFAARGYHQTSIADIAARIGIGHGTFYRYFKNKRDILEHVIDDLSAKIMNELVDENAPAAVNTMEEYRIQARRIGLRLAALVAENPQVARLLLFEATSIDASMTQRLMGLLDQGGKLVASYIEHGVKVGFFRSDVDAEASGHAMVGMMMMAVLRLSQNPGNLKEQKRMAGAIHRLFEDGLVQRI